ncbi:MAG: hypothetical protein HY811_07770 [Planctomycetes bacterium]|nr:hypothetical protein [Planctomycetota bacterium]
MKKILVGKTVIIITLLSIGIISYGGTCFNSDSKDKSVSTGSSGIYEATGITDTDFGTAGIVTSVIGDSCYINGLAIQADGKILGAGFSSVSSNEDFAVARYTTAGILDNAFGTNGAVTNTVGASNDQISRIEIQADGKIVAAGYASSGFSKSALARYTASGALDATFGTNGIITTTLDIGSSVFNDLKIQPDGKIVAGGYANFAFALARYTDAGVLDGTFGTGGVITSLIGAGSSVGLALELQPDGKLLLAGYNDTSYVTALARYTVTGTLDTTCGINGAITTAAGANNDERAYDIALQSDGKILLCGYTSNLNNDYFGFILRYDANGALDSSFGTNGVVTQTIATYKEIGYYGMSLQANGKIVVAGYIGNGIILARYNTNGTIDTGFGVDGIIIVPTTGSYTYANDVKIQADGKIIVGGRHYQAGLSRYILIRYK